MFHIMMLFACSSVHGQSDLSLDEEGFVLVETDEEGEKRAECLTSELASGLDSCRWVIRKGSNLELLYQFDNAHRENKTHEDRDDSFLKEPMEISLYDEELNETISFEMTPYSLDYAKFKGVDAVYLDFSNPRVISNSPVILIVRPCST